MPAATTSVSVDFRLPQSWLLPDLLSFFQGKAAGKRYPRLPGSLVELGRAGFGFGGPESDKALPNPALTLARGVHCGHLDGPGQRSREQRPSSRAREAAGQGRADLVPAGCSQSILSSRLRSWQVTFPRGRGARGLLGRWLLLCLSH